MDICPDTDIDIDPLDLSIGLMSWTTSMISDFKFSTQLISTVFLVGIAVFEVSTQCIRRCLFYRFGNGFFHSLHFDLAFARIQVV